MSGSQTLRVDRAATGDGQVKETKTHETRTVDLTPDVVATLKRHLTWLRAEALRLGTGEPEWLFPRADDTLVNKNYAAGVFRRILKRAGLPHYRVYDLRHTFASLLLAESAPITYVSAQLGHSSPASTMRFYARWLPSQGKRWVNALDRKTRPRVAAEGNMEPESGTRTAASGRRDGFPRLFWPFALNMREKTGPSGGTERPRVNQVCLNQGVPDKNQSVLNGNRCALPNYEPTFLSRTRFGSLPDHLGPLSNLQRSALRRPRRGARAAVAVSLEPDDRVPRRSADRGDHRRPRGAFRGALVSPR